MKKKLYLLILASLLLLVSACGKTSNTHTSNIDESTTENTTTESTTTENITTTEPTTKDTVDPTTDTTPIIDKEDVTPVINGTLSIGSGYIAGLDANAKVCLLKNSTANGLDTETIGQWENLTSIAIGGYYSPYGYEVVALKADGTVYSIINNLQSWSDIVMVAASDSDIIGLKKDGTVLSKGATFINKNEWQDIVQVSAGHEFLLGLKKDKTVVAGGVNTFGQTEVANWTDVEMVSAGYNHVVGLRSNGTVLAAGVHFLGQCDVAEWKDIVFVAAGRDFTVGVKSDGTVLATGYNIDKRCAGIEDWTNVAYVFAGENCVVGVTRDGKVLGAGYLGTIDVAELKDIVLPTADFDIDFSKQLADVEQKYIDLEVKAIGFDGEETYLEPENGILKAGKFSIQVSEEIADRICYLSDEDTIDIYFKGDFSYQYDSTKNCITYWPARAGLITANTDISYSIACITPTWVLGDGQERKEVNEYIHTVLKQICDLAGKEYTYQDYIYIEEDGNVRGSDLYELYFEYEDGLTVEERIYYTFGPPTDAQLTFIENGEELGAIRDYLRTSVEIIPN